MKPTPFAVRRALVLEGVPAEQAVMIGDQMLTDVTAGNLAGLKTILVRPQSQVDLWYTQLFRVVEHHLLGRRCFKGEERH
jgi:predicted HAD superfamily phosphohydrolase YqeG